MKAIILTLLLAGCAHAAAPLPRAAPAPRHSSSSQPPPKLEPPWGMPELFAAINRQRRGAGSPALEVDRGLCAVAERANAAYQRLGRGSEQHVLGLANQDLQGFNLSFSHTLAAVVVVEDVREAPQLLSAALDPSMVYAGLVVGTAPAPVGPRGGYAVVLTLGQ